MHWHPSRRRQATLPALLVVVLVVVLSAALSVLVVASTPAPSIAAAHPTRAEVAERAGAQRRATLVVSTKRAVAGEVLELRGRVPAPGVRRVALQRKGPQGWLGVARGKATRGGVFRFQVIARPTTTRYRVKTLGAGAAVTPGRRVVALAQSAGLDLAGSAGVGDRLDAVAGFVPARPGRPVELERQVGGAWQSVARGVQDSAGRASLAVVLDSAGPRTYRVVAPTWGRVAAATSSSRTVSVSSAPLPQGLGPVADVRVASTSPSSVALAWTNPTEESFTGVMIRRAEGSVAPATPTSGTLVAELGRATGFTDAGLDPATQYSYALFAHDTVPRYAEPATSTATTVDRDDVAAGATVTASSYAAGSSPRDVTGAGAEQADSGWRTTSETTGAWLELAWSQPQQLHRLVLTRPPLDRGGILTGTLSFDDGSSLQVALATTSTRTVVPFVPRAVRSVRFTVASANAGAGGVGLTRVSAVAAASADPAENVATPAPADGDVAASASLSTSATSGDVSRLVDGGVGGTGATWSVGSPSQAWVQLDWARPRELTTIAVAGAPSAAALRSATLSFSDGTRMTLGAVLADPTRPTVVSFKPRVTTSVRISFGTVDGAGALTLAEVSAYQRGAPALRTPGGTAAPWTDHPVDCSSRTRPGDATGLVVRCPTNGSTVGGRASLTVATGPSYTSVRASIWPAQVALPAPTTVTATPDAAGIATLSLDATSLPTGPFTVNLVATSPSARSRSVHLGLYRAGGAAPAASVPAVRGRSMVYDEEFDRPLALSRTGAGADYSTAKPERTYGADFGDAIFADPSYGLGNVRVVDGQYLKLSTQPTPSGFNDPQGWGRTRVGGMLASARPGGSGFSAQYGYFEARMLLPAGTGTWPAFWMLPSPNLVAAQPSVAEIDALEHYGHNPTGACHTTHQYPDPAKVGVALCGTRWSSEREALGWHTYGVAVEPTRVTFFIDGVQVGSAPQVAGGSDPMFWLVDLSLGGGFPIDLGPTQDRTDLYVDWIRVWV